MTSGNGRQTNRDGESQTCFSTTHHILEVAVLPVVHAQDDSLQNRFPSLPSSGSHVETRYTRDRTADFGSGARRQNCLTRSPSPSTTTSSRFLCLRRHRRPQAGQRTRPSTMACTPVATLTQYTAIASSSTLTTFTDTTSTISPVLTTITTQTCAGAASPGASDTETESDCTAVEVVSTLTRKCFYFPWSPVSHPRPLASGQTSVDESLDSLPAYSVAVEENVFRRVPRPVTGRPSGHRGEDVPTGHCNTHRILICQRDWYRAKRVPLSLSIHYVVLRHLVRADDTEPASTPGC